MRSELRRRAASGGRPAGAMDGVSTHHLGSQRTGTSGTLLELVRGYWESPTVRNKAALYEFLVKNNVVSLIDPFLELLREQTDVNHQRLYELAKSLATESPDREPVKFGIAVLGLYGQEADVDIYRILGRHDEFTLFCAVALEHTCEPPDEELWQVAKNVHGWGRIHVVERLRATENPAIRDWLLRQGYRNSVMHEYLAYSCAVGGGLRAALEQEIVDDELFVSAGEIIQALIAGGPAESMDGYEDGAAVVELYLDQAQRRASSLADFLVINTIRDFLTDQDADWPSRASRGWTPEKRQSLQQSSQVLDRPVWRDRVLEALHSDDEQEFHRAGQAASVLRIDAWPFHWERVQRMPLEAGRWYHVMKHCNDDRIGGVISLAEAALPLAEIGTGPAAELGFGPGYEGHSCLDFILQELERFPGFGGRLVEVGLQSPTIRNRNLALKVLSEWGQDHWPENMLSQLEEARRKEPDEQVQRRIENIIAGRPLENGLNREDMPG